MFRGILRRPNKSGDKRNEETPLALGQSILVVPKSSAVVPGQVDAEAIPVMADHRNMVKFKSPKSGDFIRITNHLKLMVESAPANINENWRVESMSIRE
jgi:hypothetical protein